MKKMEVMEKAKQISSLIHKKGLIDDSLDLIKKRGYRACLLYGSSTRTFQTDEISTISTEAILHRLEAELNSIEGEIYQLLGQTVDKDKSFSSL